MGVSIFVWEKSNFHAKLGSDGIWIARVVIEKLHYLAHDKIK